MRIQGIVKALQAGKSVYYTIRRRRGYLHGDKTLVIRPEDLEAVGKEEINRRLRNFRRDEAPYDKPRWTIVITKET